jgi:hypothetical protein
MIASQGRELPGLVGGGQHPLLHPRGRGDGAGHGQPGRGLAQAADLSVARRADLQVALELLALVIADGVEYVAAGENVQIGTHVLHQVTSMQSRILYVRPAHAPVFDTCGRPDGSRGRLG